MDHDAYEWGSLVEENRKEWAVTMVTLEKTCLEKGMFVCSRGRFRRRNMFSNAKTPCDRIVASVPFVCRTVSNEDAAGSFDG